MAAPQLLEAQIKNPEKILLSFDKPLDDEVIFPVTCFSINYGRIPIQSAEYFGTAEIVLVLDQAMTARDKLEVNYQPPDLIAQAIRGAVGDNPSTVKIKRNAVRAFYKVPVKNLLAVDETNWSANSNLGGGKRFIPDGNSPDVDTSLPGFDICGDGSVIIGNPNNIVNQHPHGAILTITTLAGGSGYTDGKWADVPTSGGFGSGASLSLEVVGGSVIAAGVSDEGKLYRVGDILTVDGTDFGAAGVGFSIEVETIYDAYAEAGAAGVGGADSDTGSGGGSSDSSQATRIQDLPYPNIERPVPRVATPDDFILAYGLKEAIQISNLDNADATEPNTAKIWMAIEDAVALIDNYITQATRAGKLLISSSRRRTSLIIARYYLDTVRRREDVKNDYEMAIKELDKSRTLQDISRPELPWWADPCNPLRGQGVRSHRIPQYYNGVSGKGLSGHWTDSGYSEVDDWRYDRDNAEGNNDQGNFNGTGYNEGRVPSQPTDEGGSNDGGDTP